jgi:hypothetical protein
MNSSKAVVRVKGGKAWYCHGLMFKKCLCLNADEQIIAGEDWLQEIISSGISEVLMLIHEPEFDAYRRDADEDWILKNISS